MASHTITVRGGNSTRMTTVVLPPLPCYCSEEDLRPWQSLQERTAGRG
jgi:hypothetical protein